MTCFKPNKHLFFISILYVRLEVNLHFILLCFDLDLRNLIYDLSLKTNRFFFKFQYINSFKYLFILRFLQKIFWEKNLDNYRMS